MLRALLILLLVALPASTSAGIRATYRVDDRRNIYVDIADNGDISTTLWSGERLIVRNGEAFIVEERLTGPLVTRVADLAAAATEPSPHEQARTRRAARSRIVERGTAEVYGRIGSAYFLDEAGIRSSQPMAVMSHDLALAGLGAALRHVETAEILLNRLDILRGNVVEYPASEDFQPPRDRWIPLESRDPRMLALLDRGAPLRHGYWELREVEPLVTGAEGFALPAAPETRDAMLARHRAEQEEMASGPSEDPMISRAEFAVGRLWLLTDQGNLSSLVEGETTRTRHEMPGDVLDFCVHGQVPVALVSGRQRSSLWAVRRWDGRRWRADRSLDPAGESLVALACDAERILVLTSRRLIDLGQAEPDELALSEPLRRAQVRSVVHVTPDAAFVGINAGEWGGGLKRIDRRTGRVTTIERNATGDLCDGPLNTSCDPVNGIVTLPWRPQCIAAAIGLIHFMSHGRIVKVCPDGVEQLFVAIDGVDLETAERPDQADEAARGGYGSVAFFDLAVTLDTLVAAGHNGLHRIGADGHAVHQPWPRFIDADGVLVSFALPDVVLVMTQLNRRASVSGSSPLLVVR